MLMAEAHTQNDRAAWFRTAWLACAVRGTIWGKDGADPWQLLGWQKPDTRTHEEQREEYDRAWWRDYARILKKQQQTKDEARH